MKTLLIKDLPKIEKLDRKAMAEVYGGDNSVHRPRKPQQDNTSKSDSGGLSSPLDILNLC